MRSLRLFLSLVILLTLPETRAADYVWQNVKIVAGGFIPGIVFSPASSGLAFCRTDMGGAYLWNPSKKQWFPLTDWAGPSRYNLMGIESIALDPFIPRRVYLAAGMYSGNPAAILRSRSGTDFAFDTFPVPFRMGGNEDGRGVGERLAIDPLKPSILYYGSRFDGLWISRDMAATWNKVTAFPFAGHPRERDKKITGLSFVLFDPSVGPATEPTRTIWVGLADPAEHQLYRSTDAGQTWAAVPGQPPAGLFPRHAVCEPDGTLYLSYGNGAGPNGVTDGAVWRYRPADNTWKNITPRTPNSPGERGFGYGGLSIDRQHPGTVMVATLDRWGRDDIFRSTDGGTTWASLLEHSTRTANLSPYLLWGKSSPAFGWWIDALAIDPFDSDHVLYATGATLWGTHDITALDAGKVTHWTPEADGIEQTAVISLISLPAGAHLISGLGDIGGFVHRDLTVSPPQGMMTHPDLTNTDSLDYAELKPEIIARVGRGPKDQLGGYSTDSGTTWHIFPTMASAQGGGQIAVSADGTTFLWTPQDAPAALSQDRGTTWTPCAGLPNGIHPIADRVNPHLFHALDLPGGTLYTSHDDGHTFTGQPLQFTTPEAIRDPGWQPTFRAVPGNEGDLWLSCRQTLYHLNAARAILAPVPEAGKIITFGFGKAAPDHDYPALYIASSIGKEEGIFGSEDRGKTWTRLNDDQHQYGSHGPVIGDPRLYGRVYFGTNGRGIIYGDPIPAKPKPR